MNTVKPDAHYPYIPAVNRGVIFDTRIHRLVTDRQTDIRTDTQTHDDRPR